MNIQEIDSKMEWFVFRVYPLSSSKRRISLENPDPVLKSHEKRYHVSVRLLCINC